MDLKFPERLKELRTNRGISQDILAKAIDVDNANITRYERNTQEPCMTVLAKLSIFFDVSVDYLVGLED